MMEKEGIKSEKLRENLFPLLAGVVIFTLSVTLFRSTIINLGKLKAENRVYDKKLADLKHKSELLASLDNNDLEQKVKNLEEVFPSEKPVLNLIASLLQLAREEKVSFSGLQLNPGLIQKPLQEIKATEPLYTEEQAVPAPAIVSVLQDFTIGFGIQGSMPAIISFITKLERTSPLMKIETFGLSLEGPAVSLSARVYYQALPETLGKIEQPVPLLNDQQLKVLEEIADYRKIEYIQAVSPVGKEDIFSPPGTAGVATPPVESR